MMAMSHLPATVPSMSKCDHCDQPARYGSPLSGELCEQHAENWARTAGLVSQLALSPRDQYGQPAPHGIEINVGKHRLGAGIEHWATLKQLIIENERIVLETVEGDWVVRSYADGVPKWRRF